MKPTRIVAPRSSSHRTTKTKKRSRPKSFLRADREEALEILDALAVAMLHVSIDSEDRPTGYADQITTSLIDNAARYLKAHLGRSKEDQQREEHLSMLTAHGMSANNHLRERMRMRLTTIVNVEWTPAETPDQADRMVIELKGPATVSPGKPKADGVLN